MRRFTIEEPVFKTEPLFIFDCDFATMAAYLKRMYRIDAGLDNGQTGQMFTFQDRPRGPYRIVWSHKLDAGTVMHEILHLVTRICQDKGIPIVAHHDDGSFGDETAAYLMEFFARRALRHVK